MGSCIVGPVRHRIGTKWRSEVRGGMNTRMGVRVGKQVADGDLDDLERGGGYHACRPGRRANKKTLALRLGEAYSFG
jgi:hypothetical protein